MYAPNLILALNGVWHLLSAQNIFFQSPSSSRNVTSLDFISDWDCALKYLDYILSSLRKVDCTLEHVDCILSSMSSLCIVQRLVRGEVCCCRGRASSEHFISGSIHKVILNANSSFYNFKKPKSRKRTSPLKLECNACQESSENFYIETNNIQQLASKLEIPKFWDFTVDCACKIIFVWRSPWYPSTNLRWLPAEVTHCLNSRLFARPTSS